MADDVQGARDAARFLIELGHSRIALLAVKNSTTSKRRTQGYREAFRQTGCKLHEECVVEGPGFSEDSGYTLMKVLLDSSTSYKVARA